MRTNEKPHYDHAHAGRNSKLQKKCVEHGKELEDRAAEYKKELEVAINEVLIDAPEIKGAIEKIREEGYDVFLMVEATIGFNKCEDGSSKEITQTGTALNLTSQDEKFLRQLKISPN